MRRVAAMAGPSPLFDAAPSRRPISVPPWSTWETDIRGLTGIPRWKTSSAIRCWRFCPRIFRKTGRRSAAILRPGNPSGSRCTPPVRTNGLRQPVPPRGRRQPMAFPRLRRYPFRNRIFRSCARPAAWTSQPGSSTFTGFSSRQEAPPTGRTGCFGLPGKRFQNPRRPLPRTDPATEGDGDDPVPDRGGLAPGRGRERRPGPVDRLAVRFYGLSWACAACVAFWNSRA